MPVSDQGFKTGGGSLEQQLTAVSAELSSDLNCNKEVGTNKSGSGSFYLNVAMTRCLDSEDSNNQLCALCLVITNVAKILYGCNVGVAGVF